MNIPTALIFLWSLSTVSTYAQNLVFAGQTNSMVTQLADTSITINTACPFGNDCCTVEKQLQLDLNGDSMLDFSARLFFVRHDCPASHVYAGLTFNTDLAFCTYLPPQLPWMNLQGNFSNVFPHLYSFGDTIRCDSEIFPAPWTTMGQWRTGTITNQVTGELIYGGLYKDHEYLGFRSVIQGDTLFGWIQLNFEASFGMGGYAKCTVEGYAIQSPNLTNVLENPVSTILVYPNPTSGSFQVQSKQAQNVVKIEVLNAAGSLVKRHEMRQTDSFEMDISDVPVGMYILLLFTEKDVFKQKILKL
ncbi:MAG: T9SS type A sorting domain-containing protein [Lewinellaceae bacterium]|nr:T9SS type A sorting domain-containing protein [Lewinellaceae bacterium]